MKAFITKGCFTDHGGKIDQGDDSWIVEGKAVHLEGMTHYCPKCNIISKAIASERGFILVNGRNVIVAGDISTCGARYMKISDLIVRDKGSGLLNNLHNITNKLKFDECVQLIDQDDGTPLVNVSYYLKNSKTGNILAKGVTDQKGYTERLYTEKSEEIDIYIGEIE